MINLTEVKGPTQDIRTPVAFFWTFFLGTDWIEVVLLKGLLKKVNLVKASDWIGVRRLEDEAEEEE